MSGYTEVHLIEQPGIQLMEHELGWAGRWRWRWRWRRERFWMFGFGFWMGEEDA